MSGELQLGMDLFQITFVTIHKETSLKSPLWVIQIMLYLESACPKL